MAEMQVRRGLQVGGDAVLTSGLKSSPAQAITGLMVKGNWERFLPPGLGLSRLPLQSLSLQEFTAKACQRPISISALRQMAGF